MKKKSTILIITSIRLVACMRMKRLEMMTDLGIVKIVGFFVGFSKAFQRITLSEFSWPFLAPFFILCFSRHWSSSSCEQIIDFMLSDCL